MQLLKRKIPTWWLLVLWLVLTVVACIMGNRNGDNNFLIFRQSFWHAFHQLPLYDAYPQEYLDTNHYGPFFTLLIAPFAVVPKTIGMLLWLVMLTLTLYVAVRRSLLTVGRQQLLMLFVVNNLYSALLLQQFNVAVVALLLLSFTCVEKEKDVMAAFFIAVGFMVKIYGGAGLSFFFFSRHKRRFVLALAGWLLLLFALPMLYSSPDYIVGQYGAWMESLSTKNGQNIFAFYQNISLLGMVRKMTGCADYSDLWVAVPGMVLFVLPYLRVRQYAHLAFRWAFLASALLFIIIFSSGSEACSYIIAMTGVFLWYATVPWKRNGWDVALLVFALLLSGFGNSDLIPRVVRKTYIQPYALMALPCTLVWLKLIVEMLTRDYAKRE